MKASSRQGGENERRTGWAILRLQPGPAAWIFFVLLPDLGAVLRSCPRIWGMDAHDIPGGHVCACDHLIQSVTGRTTGGFPVTATLAPQKRYM